MPTTNRARRCGLGLTAAALTLTACAGNPTATPQHNQQDVAFTQQMIPHHQQAITMADTELAGGASPAVRGLATAIKGAQGPEIDRMRGWLGAWHAAPSTSPMAMDGMMSDQQMRGFAATRGRALDRMFLRLMITHHRGAVDMAAAEIRGGRDPRAVALARSISTSQQDQIRQMSQLLGTT